MLDPLWGMPEGEGVTAAPSSDICSAQWKFATAGVPCRALAIPRANYPPGVSLACQGSPC